MREELKPQLDWKGLAIGCVDALNHPERSLPEKPLITVEIKGSLPRKGWPRPKRLLCENSRGGRVYHYDAMNLLAAMAAHGLIEVAASPSEPAQEP